MDKQTFIEILQVALLHFDGLPEEAIRKLLPNEAHSDFSVRAGIKLSEYLQSIKLRKEIQNE